MRGIKTWMKHAEWAHFPMSGPHLRKSTLKLLRNMIPTKSKKWDSSQVKITFKYFPFICDMIQGYLDLSKLSIKNGINSQKTAYTNAMMDHKNTWIYINQTYCLSRLLLYITEIQSLFWCDRDWLKFYYIWSNLVLMPHFHHFLKATWPIPGRKGQFQLTVRANL